ncbi:MAG: zf-HC2 domain-containing protein [Gemmatimonadaceae bacterium]
MTTFNLTCEAVEATLPDYLDGTLEEWLRKPIEEHLRECVRCADRARDLRNIEREAAALPALLPGRELWSGIAHRIGAPITASEPAPKSDPLTPTPLPSVFTTEPSLPTIEPSEPMIEPSSPPSEQAVPSSEPLLSSSMALVPTTVPTRALHARRKMSWGPKAMGLAAAALILVTAGTTFLATAHWLKPTQTTSFVAGSGTHGGSPGATPQRISSGAAPQRISGVTSLAVPIVPAPSVDSEHVVLDSSGSKIAGGALPSSLAVATTSASQTTPSPDEVVYGKEIKMLQGVMRRRKAELDTSTTGVIEKNLRIVNSAIDQCRAALQKDPGNSLIDSQISWALEMKVELLRRAAMLQSRT